MDPDHLMEREAQRQRFLDGVKRHMMDHEDEGNSQRGRVKAQLGWLIAIGNLFATIEGVPPIKNTITAGEYQVEIDLFRTNVMPAIREFAYTDEEAVLMASQLFMWVSESLATKARVPYEVQLVDEPERLLGKEVPTEVT